MSFNKTSSPHQAQHMLNIPTYTLVGRKAICGKWWNCDEVSEGASATFLAVLSKLSVNTWKQKGCYRLEPTQSTLMVSHT